LTLVSAANRKEINKQTKKADVEQATDVMNKVLKLTEGKEEAVEPTAK
jgi:hypothetical protein